MDFHPAWHRLLDTALSYGLTAASYGLTAVSFGLTAVSWPELAANGAHLRRAAGFIARSQVEAGHGRPVSTSYAAVPVIAASPELSATWSPQLASREYDFGPRPHAGMDGVLAGMALTEKHAHDRNIGRSPGKSTRKGGCQAA